MEAQVQAKLFWHTLLCKSLKTVSSNFYLPKNVFNFLQMTAFFVLLLTRAFIAFQSMLYFILLNKKIHRKDIYLMTLLMSYRICDIASICFFYFVFLLKKKIIKETISGVVLHPWEILVLFGSPCFE